MTNSTTPVAANDIETYVEQGYADNNGVKIHYASLGSGPLIVMIHGFPDYWYTWRNQMVALAPHYQAVALDLRGYNLSDKPKGVDTNLQSDGEYPIAAACMRSSLGAFMRQCSHQSQRTGRIKAAQDCAYMLQLCWGFVRKFV